LGGSGWWLAGLVYMIGASDIATPSEYIRINKSGGGQGVIPVFDAT